MIAIGCATTDEQAFRAAAAPTIELLDEGNSLLLRRHGNGPVADHCNEMLAVAARRDDLEAFVLVHQDTVVDTPAHVLAQIRGLLAGGPDVAVVGAGDGRRPNEVAAVDGTLLALSPWAVRNLRFDPMLAGSADAAAKDVSLQARAAGRRVLEAPLGLARLRPTRASRAARRRQLLATVAVERKWELGAAL